VIYLLSGFPVERSSSPLPGGGCPPALSRGGGASLRFFKMFQLLGAIFLHLPAKLLEIRDITLPAYARGLAGIEKWRFVPINRTAKTASLDHGLPSFPS